MCKKFINKKQLKKYFINFIIINFKSKKERNLYDNSK